MEKPEYLNLPWKADRHSDPLVAVLHIVDSKGRQVCSFYGDFENSAKALKYILDAVNPKDAPIEVQGIEG